MCMAERLRDLGETGCFGPTLDILLGLTINHQND
jgi:hypothetical protein